MLFSVVILLTAFSWLCWGETSPINNPSYTGSPLTRLKDGKKYVHVQTVETYWVMDRELFVYDGYIYVPYILTTPAYDIEEKIKGLIDTSSLFGYDLGDCHIKDILVGYKNIATSYIRNAIPGDLITGPDYSLYDDYTLKTKIVNKNLADNMAFRRSHMIPLNSQLNSSLSNVITNSDPAGLVQDSTMSHITRMSRSKRLAPLLIGFIAAGTALASGFVWNRVDIASLQSNIALLDADIEKVYSKINDHDNAINTLSSNDRWFHETIKVVTEEIEVMRRQINCQTVITGPVLQSITQWVYLTVQSYIRAVNSALNGKLNTDILPGNKLSSLITTHLELQGTVYQDSPLLLYKYGVFELHKLDKEKLFMSGLVVLPNIKRVSSGFTYIPKTCPFTIPPLTVQLRVSDTVLIEHQDPTWSKVLQEECVQDMELIICPPHAVGIGVDSCTKALFNSNRKEAIDACRYDILAEPHPEIIPLKMGVILCPINQTTNLISTGPAGNEVNRVLDLHKSSILLTAINGTRVIYNNVLHMIRPGSTLTVEGQFLAINLTNPEHFRPHQLPPGWSDIPRQEHIDRLKQTHESYLVTALGVSITIIILVVSLIIWIIYRQRRQWAGVKRLATYVAAEPNMLTETKMEG